METIEELKAIRDKYMLLPNKSKKIFKEIKKLERKIKEQKIFVEKRIQHEKKNRKHNDSKAINELLILNKKIIKQIHQNNKERKKELERERIAKKVAESLKIVTIQVKQNKLKIVKKKKNI